MLVLVTDFGLAGPYTGQMKAVLHQAAAGVPQVDLFADAPAFDPRSTAYLLPAYIGHFPLDSVFLVVVDPGVGTERDAVVLRADGRWFVGPDNGVLALVARRSRTSRWWRIGHRPRELSNTFHGRDLFAPVAAALVSGGMEGLTSIRTPATDTRAWPDDRAAIVYVDHYGNLLTGLRAERVPEEVRLVVAGRTIERARTFGEVAEGAPFWYENSNGLVEIAVNRGRADRELGAGIGEEVGVLSPEGRLS